MSTNNSTADMQASHSLPSPINTCSSELAQPKRDYDYNPTTVTDTHPTPPPLRSHRPPLDRCPTSPPAHHKHSQSHANGNQKKLKIESSHRQANRGGEKCPLGCPTPTLAAYDVKLLLNR